MEKNCRFIKPLFNTAYYMYRRQIFLFGAMGWTLRGGEGGCVCGASSLGAGRQHFVTRHFSAMASESGKRFFGFFLSINVFHPDVSFINFSLFSIKFIFVFTDHRFPIFHTWHCQLHTCHNCLCFSANHLHHGYKRHRAYLTHPLYLIASNVRQILLHICMVFHQ